MKCVINNEIVLSRGPDGPVAAHIGAFARSQSAQGYSRFSIHRQVLLAAGFSHWLKQRGVALPYVNCDQTSRYLRDRARRVRLGQADAAALRHLVDFLRREGVTAAEKIIPRRMTPAERCAHEYGQHLPDTCALARATIINYVPFIRGYNAGAPGALLWPFPVNLAGNWGPSPTDTPSFPNAVIGYNEELGKLRSFSSPLGLDLGFSVAAGAVILATIHCVVSKSFASFRVRSFL